MRFVVTTIGVVVALAASVPGSAGAARPHTATLRVTATSSQTGDIATYSFDFHGSDVSGFQLSLPRGTQVSTANLKALSHDIVLSQPDNRRMGSQLTEAQARTVSMNLRTVSARFKVRVNLAALKLSPSVTRSIRSGHTRFMLVFTFLGAAEQTATAHVPVKL